MNISETKTFGVIKLVRVAASIAGKSQSQTKFRPGYVNGSSTFCANGKLVEIVQGDFMKLEFSK